VADGLYGRSHVDGDRHESGPNRPEEHRDEFRPVLEAERDAVTALDAEVADSVSRAGDGVGELAIGDCLLGIREDERRTIGCDSCAVVV
jgi:hypothetical protein